MSNKILTQNEIDNIKLRLGSKEKVELTRDEFDGLIEECEELYGIISIKCHHCKKHLIIDLEKV